jgi:membrane fusion protein (multidrug efflux system)
VINHSNAHVRRSAWKIVAVALLIGTAHALNAQNSDPVPPSQLRGIILPAKQVVLTAPLDGIVGKIDVVEGQRVDLDQPLVSMDDELQRAVVTVQNLEVKRQELVLEEAKVQLDRILEIQKQDAAEEWEVRQAYLQRDGAEITLQQSKAQLNLEEVRLDQYHVRAPFAGEVVRIAPEVGARAIQGDTLLQLIARDTLEAQLFLPRRIAETLEEGKSYNLAIEDEDNRTLNGKLTLVEPLVDSASNTIRCIFEIDNNNLSLRAGLTLRLVWSP